MKLHKTTYTTTKVDDTTDTHVTATGVCWHASAEAASKGRTALKAEDRNSKPETVAVEVPTDKVGLIDWLNANVTQ